VNEFKKNQKQKQKTEPVSVDHTNTNTYRFRNLLASLFPYVRMSFTSLKSLWADRELLLLISNNLLFSTVPLFFWVNCRTRSRSFAKKSFLLTLALRSCNVVCNKVLRLASRAREFDFAGEDFPRDQEKCLRGRQKFLENLTKTSHPRYSQAITLHPCGKRSLWCRSRNRVW